MPEQRTDREKNTGRIMLLCTALLYGLNGVCVKSITWGALPIIAVRSVFSLIMLLAVKRSFRLKFTRINILGAIMMTVTSILFVLSVKLTTSGTAIVLQYIAPILVFLYTVIFQGRKARGYEIILTITVFAGCVLSFADTLDFNHILGNLLAVASGFTYAGQIITMNRSGCDAQDTAIISNAMCFLIAIPFMFAEPLSWDGKNIFWLLILAIFQYGLANILFSKGIGRVDPVEASLLLTIEPVFNPIPVAIFCGEYMGPLAIIGSAAVIISVALYTLIPRILEKKQQA